MRKTMLASALAAALFAVHAQAAYTPVTKRGNLDVDPREEVIRTQSLSAGAKTAVRISDECPAGPLDVRVTGAHEALGVLKLYPADTVTGDDVFIDMRDGANGRAGEIRLVAWRRTGMREPCRRSRKTFLYNSARPTEKPMGAEFLANFRAKVGNFTSRYMGREIRLTENWARPGEASCCPSIEKRSYFHYVASADRYRLYTTVIERGRSNATR